MYLHKNSVSDHGHTTITAFIQSVNLRVEKFPLFTYTTARSYHVKGAFSPVAGKGGDARDNFKRETLRLWKCLIPRDTCFRRIYGTT